MAGIYPEIKGCLGFGFMRLPKTEDKDDKGRELIDYEESKLMVDRFMEHGFNYFDVAHAYMDERAEEALNICLTSRHPRESYILTNKLSDAYFKEEGDIRPFFEKQLEVCGVDYFDFYLMHAQDRIFYEQYTRCRAYEIAQELKEEGKVRHVGISFHDRAEVLEQILSEHPEIEVVQLQINYIDYDTESIQCSKCLEVCRKYGKPVIVMEPVKGGVLARVPEDVEDIFREVSDDSPASIALRFAAGCDGVFLTLSGMSDMNQVDDNCNHMKNFKPLDEKEREAVEKAVEAFSRKNVIPCTACRYCTVGCPMNIDIPTLFSCMNMREMFRGWTSPYYYQRSIIDKGLAKDCIGCGACEAICPQHLNIRELLEKVAETFAKQEKKEEDRRNG
ncbi:MAG: aldo/keto reductase [Clostridiales bacterium]|nr:aldo/keto reductase [Candidatus Crickella merdequi]